jgi:hypothetical protein
MKRVVDYFFDVASRHSFIIWIAACVFLLTAWQAARLMIVLIYSKFG